MKNKLKSTKSTGLIKIISRSLFIVIILCSMSFMSTCFNDLSGRGGSCDSSSDCEGSLHCLDRVCRTGGECYRDPKCVTSEPGFIYSCQNNHVYCFQTQNDCSTSICD